MGSWLCDVQRMRHRVHRVLTNRLRGHLLMCISLFVSYTGKGDKQGGSFGTDQPSSSNKRQPQLHRVVFDGKVRMVTDEGLELYN